MDKLANDELALFESRLGFRLLGVNEFKQDIIEDCWNSLRSTTEKQIRYRKAEAAINGFNLDTGGVDTGRYVLNPGGQYDVYSTIVEASAILASKLNLGITYKSKESSPDKALISRFEADQWSNIPIPIVQKMLEEIEIQLRKAAFAVAYFNEIHTTHPVLRSYASGLIKHPNIVVVCDASYRLDTPEISLQSDNDNDLFQSMTGYSLRPTRKQMTDYLRLQSSGVKA